MKAIVVAAALAAISGHAWAECATSRAEVEALLKRYNEATNAHQLDRFGEFYHDPLVYNGLETSLADYVRTVMVDAGVDLAPDLRWHIESYVIDCDTLAVRYRDTGTVVKPYRHVVPTGRPFSMAEHAFYHVRDGKFDKVWSVYDYEAFEDQTRGPR